MTVELLFLDVELFMYCKPNLEYNMTFISDSLQHFHKMMMEEEKGKTIIGFWVEFYQKKAETQLNFDGKENEGKMN